MVALPAVLVLLNNRPKKLELFVMMALPAELFARNCISPLGPIDIVLVLAAGGHYFGRRLDLHEWGAAL
jgi:hypothetical protein